MVAETPATYIRHREYEEVKAAGPNQASTAEYGFALELADNSEVKAAICETQADGTRRWKGVLPGEYPITSTNKEAIVGWLEGIISKSKERARAAAAAAAAAAGAGGIDVNLVAAPPPGALPRVAPGIPFNPQPPAATAAAQQQPQQPGAVSGGLHHLQQQQQSVMLQPANPAGIGMRTLPAQASLPPQSHSALMAAAQDLIQNNPAIMARPMGSLPVTGGTAAGAAATKQGDGGGGGSNFQLPLADGGGMMAMPRQQAPPMGGGGNTFNPPASSSSMFNGMRFVGYRVDKFVKEGEPSNRKFRRWFLVDKDGREHLAVDTTKLDNSGHFTYEAVGFFMVEAPLRCNSQADVARWLERFLPPRDIGQPQYQFSAGQGGGGQKGTQGTAASEPSASDAAGRPTSAAGAQGYPGAGLTRMPSVSPTTGPGGAMAAAGLGGGLPDTPGGLSGTPSYAAGAKPPLLAALKKRKPKHLLDVQEGGGYFIQETGMRAEVLDLHMKNVQEELAAMQARCGADFTLQVVTHNRELRFLSSTNVEVQAPQIVETKVPVYLEDNTPGGSRRGGRMGGGGGHFEDLQRSTGPVPPGGVRPRGSRALQDEDKPLPRGPDGRWISPRAAAPGSGGGGGGGGRGRPPGASRSGMTGGRGRQYAADDGYDSPDTYDEGYDEDEYDTGRGRGRQHPHYTALGKRKAGARGSVDVSPAPPPTAHRRSHPRSLSPALDGDRRKQRKVASLNIVSDRAPPGIYGRRAGGGAASIRDDKPRHGTRGRPRSTVGDRDSAPGLHQLSLFAEQEAELDMAEDGDLQALVAAAKCNEEPYVQGIWRRDLYQPYPFKHIDTFQLASDAGEDVDRSALSRKLSIRFEGEHPPAEEDPDQVDLRQPALVLARLPQALGKKDVEVRPVWGLDRFSRRNVCDALARLPDLYSGDPIDEDAAEVIKDEFICRHLLPALNSVGTKGWDIVEGLNHLKRTSQRDGDHRTVSLASGLVRLVDLAERHPWGKPAPNRKPEDREFFRVHPKGEGVVCINPDGIPANTFIEEYVGEVYCAWRWFEKQDKGVSHAAQRMVNMKRRITRMGNTPELYNMEMERPRADRLGFDIMFVNALNSGNFTCRISHSCDPNCKVVNCCVAGRLTIAIFSLRSIEPGEELTLDYACETENDKEYRQAVCLCGSPACRGSFMYLVNYNSLARQQVLLREHHFLLRNASLLVCGHAGGQLTSEERGRFEAYGLGMALLCDGDPEGGGQPLPVWVQKWAALVLGFIQTERHQLVEALQVTSRSGAPVHEAGALGEDEDTYSYDEAVAEAEDVQATRLQALAYCLDKAKMFLRHQPPELRQQPPLRVLSDAEATDYLWNGAESIAARSVVTVQHYLKTQEGETLVAGRAARGGAGGGGGFGNGPGALSRADSMSSTPGHSMHSAAPGKGGDGGEVSGSRNASDLAASLELMYEQNDPANASEARQLLRRMASVMRKHGHAHAALHDLLMLYSATHTFVAPTAYEPVAPTLASGQAGKYRSQYLWAALSSWFKGTGDPLVTLSNDRRGCLSLPEPECAYMPNFASGRYVRDGERGSLLEQLATAPWDPWPTSSSWSFRNTARVYGSPMFDLVLRDVAGDTRAQLQAEGLYGGAGGRGDEEDDISGELMDDRDLVAAVTGTAVGSDVLRTLQGQQCVLQDALEELNSAY